MNFPINSQLLASVKSSRQKYFADLEAKKSAAKAEMERRKKDEEDNAYKLKRKDKILQIDAEIKKKRVEFL